MTRLAGEQGVKEFLKKLIVHKMGEPYGNDDAFSAKDVKPYDRAANRHGHPYADYNNQRPTQRGLANPTLNVALQKEAFAAVDSVGMGEPMFRVVNVLTGEYVTNGQQVLVILLGLQ
jgi:hypothetical protein